MLALARERAADDSDLDQFWVVFETTRAEVHLSPRCFLHVHELAWLSRPCRGRHRSCSLRVVVAYANITFLLIFRSEMSNAEPHVKKPDFFHLNQKAVTAVVAWQLNRRCLYSPVASLDLAIFDYRFFFFSLVCVRVSSLEFLFSLQFSVTLFCSCLGCFPLFLLYLFVPGTGPK